MSRRLILLFMLAGTFPAMAAVEDELTFIKGLTAEGFPDLARIVLERTLKQYPEAEKSAPELRIRILIASKKFDEAGSSLATCHLPLATQGNLWLFLAQNASGEQALNAYQNYFSLTKEPEAQAAVNYGKLLEENNDLKTATELYEKILSSPAFAKATADKPNIGKSARPIKVKLAKLLTETDPDRAQKLCEDVQLGGLDLWFGNAVVVWNQIMQQKGEWDEAQSVLETQLELLKQLESSLEKQGQPVSLVSPLAGARYLLGLCYEHAGKKAEALAQFYNVYAKYGDSEWGPQAQEHAQALKDEFEAQGKTVKIDLGANRSKMEQSRFRVARRLFFDKQYAEAVPAYLAALNQYPESNESITALRELAVSAVNLNDPLLAKTVAAYTGERFSSRDPAADALLAAGKAALDKKQTDLAWWIYDRYLEFFPTNARAPGVLYSLAALKRGADQEACYNRILKDYPQSAYAGRALNRLAWNAYKSEDYKTAAERFEQVLKTETDPETQTRARFTLAESYRLSKHWKKALENFQTLETSLKKAAESYGVSDETLTFNKPFLGKSLFYQGTCFVNLGETDRAVEIFDRFINEFPDSEFVSQARFAKGSALMDAQKYREALAAFEPFNDQSDRKLLEPVLYYRGQAYLEIGQNEKAIQSLEKLLNNWPESAFFFEAKLVQGRAYAAVEQNDEAVRVLGDILSFASDDLLLNRASLELGRVQTDPAEKLASFQRVALLADPDDPEQAPLIAEALFKSLPLYLELQRPQDLLADADRLTAEFPTFGNKDAINRLREKAVIILSEKEKKERPTNLHE